jgi:hypothetical protein
MNVRTVINPYFAEGWTGWEIEVTDTTGRFSTVDGLHVGLMSGMPNPVGFPLVGNNYMLLARKAESSNDAAAASTVVLTSSANFIFNPGDVIAADFGFVLTQKDGGTVLDEFGTILKIQLGSSTVSQHRFFHLAAGADVNQPVRFTLASQSDYSVQQTNRPIRITLSFDDLASGTGSQFFEWICVDNIRVYHNVPNIPYADAYDDSGVS